MTRGQRSSDDDQGRVLGDEHVFGFERLVVLLIDDFQIEVGDPSQTLKTDDGPLEVQHRNVKPVARQRRVFQVIFELEPDRHDGWSCGEREGGRS